MTDKPLGLIAGEGVFPFLVARGARAAGRRVVCAAFDGIADPTLADEVDEFRPVSFVRLGSWARFLRKHDVAEAIMVGRVAKQNLHVKNEMLWALRQVPDFVTFWAWLTEFRRDRRSETVLLRTALELEKRGVTLIDSTTFNRDQLAERGRDDDSCAERDRTTGHCPRLGNRWLSYAETTWVKASQCGIGT